MAETFEHVYGAVPDDLVPVGANAVQFSPLRPGAALLEAQPEATLANLAILAPPGTVERRFTLALALRALRPGGAFAVLAPKDKGGSRLRRELHEFGCSFEEDARRHHRICLGQRPDVPTGLDEAVAEGAAQRVEALGLWSQPGIFSWDRLDPGSALLAGHLPPLAGHGADLGCGIGTLALSVLGSPKVTKLDLIDLDRRAIEAARRNIDDPRVAFHWADVRRGTGLKQLDFVVMNPPFHDAGTEDRSLGQSFIKRAAEALRPGGRCWLTANRHLPYEAVLKPLFRTVTLVVEAGGYKIVSAQK